MGLFDFLGRKNNGYSILELAIKSEEIRDGLGMKELALHIAMSTIADLLSRCKIKRYVKGKEELITKFKYDSCRILAKGYKKCL